jgi:predicted  nucleic acid-binding Zn-ribbon protein
MATPTMDNIKKKMQQMKNEKENANDLADQAEEKVTQLIEKLKLQETENDSLNVRLSTLDKELDKTNAELERTNADLETAAKEASDTEHEVNGLQKRITTIEEEFEKIEERLIKATQNLAEASHSADENERARKSLESRNKADKERIVQLEKQITEFGSCAEESDKRYDDVCGKITVMEVDLERTEERADSAEFKLLELAEELKVVGNNMRSLEVSEQEAKSREEGQAEQIRDMGERLKDAEERADLGERTISKLQKECDRLEDELLQEKEKYKNISEELEQTVNELQGY